MIGEGVTFSGTVVIGSGCKIEAGARLVNCVVWDNTIVGEKTLLKECVIGDQCSIGKQVRIESGAVVASHCQLGDFIDIKPAQKVFATTSGLMQLEQG